MGKPMTKNQAKKAKNPVITLSSDSEPSQSSVPNRSYSSCSSSDSSFENNMAFANIAPCEGLPRKRTFHSNLKKFKFEARIEEGRTCSDQQANNKYNPQKNEQPPQRMRLKESESEQVSIPSEFSDFEEDPHTPARKPKPKLMEQIQQQIHKPASEFQVADLKQRQAIRKRENKKRDYLIEKKYRQYKNGKKKDNISNQVFNAIEDYFM